MGWVFPASENEVPGAEPDYLNGAKSIRDLYELASTNYSGKYTVPVCIHTQKLPSCFCSVFAMFSRFLFFCRFFGIRN